jgi:hypothetical protein
MPTKKQSDDIEGGDIEGDAGWSSYIWHIFFLALLVLDCFWIGVCRWVLYYSVLLSFIWLPILVFYPPLLGWFLTKILYHTALHGFPLDFGSIHLQFWIDRSKSHDYCHIQSFEPVETDKPAKFWHAFDCCMVHFSVRVHNLGFGNPPRCPHKYFLKVGQVSLHLSLSFRTLRRLPGFALTTWSPFPSLNWSHAHGDLLPSDSTAKLKAKEMRPETLGTVNLEHLDINK